jgi:glycosyltransferase involved in cell wall biosynthesis
VSLLRNYNKAIKICIANKVTHCILHGFRYGWLMKYILRRIKRSGIKIILIVHDIESLIATGSTVTANYIFETLADTFVVHNQYTFDELKKQLPEKALKKVHIIPHGNFIGLQNNSVTKKVAFEKINLKADRKYVLFFGHIKKSKGPDILIEALSTVDKNVSLIIAGRMRKHSFTEYQQLIDKLNLQERVHSFIHYITNEERELFFKAADAVVLPYRKVYQSGVMLMAMSYNLPVIASNLDANKETIHDEINGLLFRAGDANDLSKKINQLFSNEIFAEKIFADGYKTVAEENDWNKIALDYKKIIG